LKLNTLDKKLQEQQSRNNDMLKQKAAKLNQQKS